MSNQTKTGLLLIMIGMATTIFSNIILFFTNFNVSATDIEEIYIRLLPALVIVIIGGLLILIGAIMIIISRKEYGEKHSKFVVYAILIFCISIIVVFILRTISSYTQYSLLSIGFNSSADFTGFVLITVLSSFVSAVLGSLIYVFLLYQIENKKGRYILFAAFLTSIIFSIVIAIYNYALFTDMFNEILNSGNISGTSTTILFEQLSNISKVSILSVINGILFIIAAYIPYKRIVTGELVPVLPGHLKRCRFCGRVGPSDSVICAYCGNKFVQRSDF